MKIAEQVSSEVALLAEQLFSGRELKYLPLFCTSKNHMTSMWTVLCWCPRGITSVHGWQWSIVKFQQCVEKIVTEEGLPQVSSKLDNSFPYSYPSVSYPGVFTTNAFPQISPELGHSPIPIHVFSRLVSEKERLIPPVSPSIYLQVSDEFHCTIDNSRNDCILQTERRIVWSKILSNMSELSHVCTVRSHKNIFREVFLSILTDSVGRCS